MESFKPAGHVMVSLFNGYGDCLLALPVLRSIVETVGATGNVYLAAFPNMAETVFAGLNCKRICVSDIDPQALMTDGGFDDIPVEQFISFNAYFPCPVDIEIHRRFPNIPYWGFCDLKGTVTLPESYRNIHMRDQFFHVLGLSPTYSQAMRWPHIPPQILQGLSSVFGQDQDTVRCYALHIDSLNEKMWPVERWAAVVEYLWQNWRVWPLILGEGHQDHLVLLNRFAFAKTVPMQGGIQLQFAAVQHTRFFLGIDSIFAHVADCYDKPMVVLFGPSIPSIWGPVGKAAHLVAPRHGGEMGSIDEDNVLDALVRVCRSL